MSMLYWSGIQAVKEDDEMVIPKASIEIIIEIKWRDSRRQNNQTVFIWNNKFVDEIEQLSRFESNIETKLIPNLRISL